MNQTEPIPLREGAPVPAQPAGRAAPPPAPPPSPAEPDAGEIDLLALIGTLWRGKWIVLLCALLAALAGGYYAYAVAVPMYASTASIALEDQEAQVITDIESVFAGGGPDSATINTESEVMRSRRLIGQLVDTLDLTSDPEFNPTLGPSGILGATIDSLRERLGQPASEPARLTPDEIRAIVVDRVLGAISVGNVRQSLVFTIRATTTDPEKSAAIANALAALYIDQALQAKYTANEDASAFLSQRAAELQQELETLENELAAFRDGTDLVSIERLAAQDRLLKEQRDRVEDLREAQAEIAVRLDRYRTLREAGDFAALAALADDPRLTRAVRNGSDPGALADLVVSRAEGESDRLDAQLDALLPSVTSLEEEIAALTSDLLTLQQFEREIAATRLLYENFLTRLKETDVQRGLERPDARILSDAIPRPAISPRRSLILALSLILGAMAGAALVLLHELRTSNFRTPDDLERAMGATVLGSIPLIPGGKRGKTLKYLRDKPSSQAAEAVRNLRTSLLMSSFDKPPTVTAVTSSIPGEGKTTISLALAQNMASLEADVLLIEADIRRRTFTEYFDMSKALTLTDAMQDPDRVRPGEHRNAELGVDMIGGSKAKVNAADLFSSEAFMRLIEAVRTRYDLVVIDTPPVLAVPDARIIGHYVDAMVYVVRWNQTTRRQVRQGTSMLTSVGVPIAGYALSQVDPRGMRRYGYDGEYGYDGKASRYYDS